MRDAARIGGQAFWIIMIGRIIKSFILPAELFLARRLIEIAISVANGKPLNRPALYSSFAARIMLGVVSNLLATSQNKLNRTVSDRFSAELQLEVLKLHVRLDSATLKDPSTKVKMELLEEIADPQGRRFDPFAAMSVFHSAVAIFGPVAILSRQVNASNAWILGASALSRLVTHISQNMRGRSLRVLVSESNDWLRYGNLMRLGTSSTLKREVHTLGLGEHLVAAACRTRVADAEATRPDSDNHEKWLSTFGGLGSSVTHSIFALKVAKDTPSAALLHFYEISTLDQAVQGINQNISTIHWKILDLGRYFKMIEAYYDCQALLEDARPGGDPYVPASRTAHGQQLFGMEIEFRNVTVKYPSAAKPALDNVSFRILPGGLISIVGKSGCGKTTSISLLSMTHRYNLSPKADRLLYFADGRLVEEGSHANLMQIEDGQYRHMWTVQAAGYQTASSSEAGEPDL